MGYLGIELDELICLLSRGHEAVFSLNGNQYIIQPVQSDSLYGDLVMYQSSPIWFGCAESPSVRTIPSIRRHLSGGRWGFPWWNSC